MLNYSMFNSIFKRYIERYDLYKRCFDLNNTIFIHSVMFANTCSYNQEEDLFISLWEE